MHARFESCMKTLWQLELGGQGGGVKLSKKVHFQLEHNTTHLYILSR
jgi:hypothetical protein